jgi:hypothetical protein
LATAVGAVAEQVTCTPCMGSDGMGQGRPHSPYLYKYHPNAEEKWGGGEGKNGRKQGGKLRERNWQCWERRNRNSRNRKPGISTERPREANGEKEEKRTEGVNQSGLVSLHRGEEELSLSSGFSVTATAAPPRTIANTTVSSAIRDHRLR